MMSMFRKFASFGFGGFHSVTKEARSGHEVYIVVCCIP